jgi:ADP-ribose pyrophosphatase YjhB (NUDIX family)
MEKRVSARAIIIENNQVLTMFRRKKKDDGSYKEYYVIPGGGTEPNETLEETCIRELKEEYNVDIKILGYLGKDEKEKTIGHIFHAEIINGIPTLGGEEEKRNNQDNYYEIRRIDLDKINEIDIDAIEFINKAKNLEYEGLDNVKNR